MGFIMLRRVAGENTGNGGQASIITRFIVPRFNDERARLRKNNRGT